MLQDRSKTEAAVKKAQELEASLVEQRRTALQRGDDKAVDALERQLEDARKIISRGEERLSILGEDLRAAEARENAERDLAERKRAEESSKAGAALIRKDITDLQRALAAKLRLLAVHNFLVRSYNKRHPDSPIAMPNSVRCELRKVIPTRTETVELPGGLTRIRELPAEVIRGYEPDELCDTVLLPQVFAGDETTSWGDESRLYYGATGYGGRYLRFDIGSTAEGEELLRKFAK